MKMYTEAFNSLRDLNNFVNSHGIEKQNVVSIFQAEDSTYILIYYANE